MIFVRTRLLKATGLCITLFAVAALSVQGFFPGLPQRVWAVAVTPNQLKPIYAVETGEKKVAISFDAAWGAEFTPRILEIMKRYGLKTTFFLVGFWVDKYPDMVKRIAAEGHEVQNHSTTHPHSNQLTEDKIVEELITTGNKIKELTAQEPFLFRPPFGEYSNKVINAATRAGYMTIQWDVDSLDWKETSADEIAKRVLKQVKPGSIVLFHNNGEHTTEALVPIIEKLISDGYTIVPVSQLVYRERYTIDPVTGIQHPSR